MTSRSIYRSADGRRAIREHCEQRLREWARPHSRTVLDSSLGRTHVVRAGDGPAVVLLSGTNFCATATLRTLEALAAHFEVHAVDLPGQPGLSHDVRPTDAVPSYGNWMAEILPLLTDGHAILLGHSLGGLVALAGVAHDAEVARLVLVDPAGLMRLRVPAGLLRATLPWYLTPDATNSARLLRQMMAPDAKPPDTLIDWMTLVGRHVRSSLAPRPLREHDLYRARAVPTTVVSGRHDAFLPPAPLIRSVHARLPDAEVAIAEEAGHLVPEERPDAIVEVLGP